jgi:hypothetical protein
VYQVAVQVFLIEEGSAGALYLNIYNRISN